MLASRRCYIDRFYGICSPNLDGAGKYKVLRSIFQKNLCRPLTRNDTFDCEILSAMHGAQGKATVRDNDIDGQEIRAVWPEHARFEVGGARVWMTHIGGRPPRYTRGILPELKTSRPDFFVCGHSHILLVQRSNAWGGLHLNPGAAGKSGFHKVSTLLKFELHEGNISNLRVVEWPRTSTKV